MGFFQTLHDNLFSAIISRFPSLTPTSDRDAQPRVPQTQPPPHAIAQPQVLRPQPGPAVATQPLTGVTFSPAAHPADPFPETAHVPPLEFLKKACPDVHPTCEQTLYCSLGHTLDMIPQRNGFVRTVLECYNRHRALVLRPDDVWLAIMTQFYCFVNGRAEELRSLFVLHDGKKELTMEINMDPLAPVDTDSLIGSFVEYMSQAIQENVVDPELRQWMLPAFSTTTRADLVTAASIMMGTMKEYFTYRMMLLCGIPRVTLLGEKKDWEELVNRIEKLKEFGSDSTAWYHMLHPILSRFVRSFDEPHHPDNLEFWNKVAHYRTVGSGSDELSGWITAFMMFDESGKWMGSANGRYYRGLELDGVAYPFLDSEAIPAGYSQVDITLEVKGKGERSTALVAGFIGTQIRSSGDKSLSKMGERDTAAPEIAWWWFVKAEPSKQPDAKPRNQLSQRGF